jgi:hypothetical protein
MAVLTFADAQDDDGADKRRWHQEWLMKSIRAAGCRIFVTVALLALTACGGSDAPSNPSPNTLSNGFLSASINGASFNATSARVVTDGRGLVSIGGGNASGQTIGFAWVNTGTGTYNIGGATIATHTFQGNTWSASSAQGSGSITLTTSTANRVGGTFSFVLQADGPSGATGTRNITQGRFDLTF